MNTTSAVELQTLAARVGEPRRTEAGDLLGGAKLLKRMPSTRAEVHATIVHGMPYSALFFLTDRITVLSDADVANVIGISARTLRRQKEEPKKTMPTDLASKTWLFAETLAKATEVFGGKAEAERWMSEHAMGLDGARPIDLLRTLQGAELVNEFLGRLEYGVYN
jgi:putative toxin-antitoxin system antitoxin component (TIGR02293 family)